MKCTRSQYVVCSTAPVPWVLPAPEYCFLPTVSENKCYYAVTDTRGLPFFAGEYDVAQASA
eukprot:2293983-Rhodomonas_salina.1